MNNRRATRARRAADYAKTAEEFAHRGLDEHRREDAERSNILAYAQVYATLAVAAAVLEADPNYLKTLDHKALSS